MLLIYVKQGGLKFSGPPCIITIEVIKGLERPLMAFGFRCNFKLQAILYCRRG